MRLARPLNRLFRSNRKLPRSQQRLKSKWRKEKVKFFCKAATCILIRVTLTLHHLSVTSGQSKASEMKTIEKKMGTSKSALQEAIAALKEQKQKIEKIELEIEEMRKEKKILEDSKMSELDKKIKAMEKELKKMEEGNGGLTERQAAYEAAKVKLQSKQDSLLSADNKIGELMREKEEVSQAHINTDVELKKLAHQVKRFHKDKAEALKYVEHMEQKHSFISAEKQFFGKPGTDFDFKKTDPEEAQRRLAQLDEEQHK